ncbi:hypothetical protein Sango_2205200 [Sesamum angolense]|uniref:Uncharacterized protein n=1 Tax=Sesamum angolense TaxID=2727404 RepID=A0AAE2BKF5_9LAMI|nr:hypothetical protein Sango_2205200 [Sesamum angolense]
MATRVISKVVVEAASGYVRGMPGVDEINYSGDQRVFMGKKVVFQDVHGEGGVNGLVQNSRTNTISCSDESSSIGKNSDLSESSLERSGDGEEVQSSYKGPLDAMETLEQVLPSDASSSSSIKDLAKPENAYMKKRRNMLAWDKTRSSPLRGNGGGISKRIISSGKTTLALAVAMSNSEGEKQAGECNSAGSLPVPVPYSRKDFSSWRSFSLADLQQCVSVAISNSNELATN